MRFVAHNAAAMSASQAGAAAAAAGPQARHGGLGFGLPPVPRRRADGQRGEKLKKKKFDPLNAQSLIDYID